MSTNPMSTTSSSPNPASAPDVCAGESALAADLSIPGYEIGRLLGRDEATVTYQATQTETSRDIALRLTLQQPHDSDSARARLEARCEQIANLKHPDIPSVVDTGTTPDHRRFLVTEYIQGLPICQFVQDNSLSLDETIDLFIRLCHAVDAAHQAGAVHQNLTPDNVLVSSADAPKLLNFSLAGFGAKDPPPIDLRTDIKALGAILYELITGKDPFAPEDNPLDPISEAPAIPPSRAWSAETGLTSIDARPSRPGRCPINDDLDAIIIKAIADPPDQRYQNLAAFTDDLDRCLHKRPVSAKPQTTDYLLAKAVKRNRNTIASAAAIILLLAGIAGALWSLHVYFALALVAVSVAAMTLLYAHGRNRRAAAENAARLTLDRLRQAKRRTDEAHAAAHHAEYARKIAHLRADHAETRCAFLEDDRNVQSELCQRAVRRAEDAERARDQAENKNASLQAELDAELERRRHADRQYDITHTELRNEIQRRDAAEEKAANARQAESQAKHDLDIAHAQKADADAKRQIAENALDQTCDALSAAEARNTELETRLTNLQHEINDETEGRHAAETAADQLAVALRESRDALHAAEQENARLQTRLDELEQSLKEHDESRQTVQQTLAAARLDADQFVQTAEAENRRLRDQIKTLHRTSYFTLIALAQVAYERNDIARMCELLEQCSDDLRGEDWKYLYWLATRTERTFVGHEGQVLVAAFSPDGRHVLSAAYDNTLKIWDPTTGDQIETLAGHEKPVLAAVYAPDGKTIASGSADESLRVWSPDTGQQIRIVCQANSAVTALAFSPDGRRLASGTWLGALKLWNPDTGEHLLTLPGHDALVTAIAFSSDGKFIVSASGDKTIKLWNPSTGDHIKTLTGHQEDIYDLAVSPDNACIASASADKTVRLWDVPSGREVQCFKGHEKKVSSIAFIPDGTSVVSGSWDQTLRIWDLRTGREKLTLRGHEGRVHAVAVAPDGSTILSASSDKTLRLWDMTSHLDPHPAQFAAADHPADPTRLSEHTPDEIAPDHLSPDQRPIRMTNPGDLVEPAPQIDLDNRLDTLDPSPEP